MSYSSASFSPDDHRYMARALQLAEQGLFTTSPNPRVGCVLVRAEQIVGEGFHVKAGEVHAEVHALAAAGDATQGATAYVTLEPCSHHGRTPPCADALIQAGVRRVVAAMTDPNPQVAGQGLTRLREAGIEVACGLMQQEARALNPGFIQRMQRGMPWVRLKVASSLDGKTALNNGMSQWITSPESRKDVHRLRARSCAMLTGIGTVLGDNPALTVRAIPTTRQPMRVVVDSSLQIQVESQLVQNCGPDDGPLLVVCAENKPVKADLLRMHGVDVLYLPGSFGRVDLRGLLKELARRGINEVMVEAGSKLNGALLQEHLIDEIVFYLAPSLLGNQARGLFDIPELTTLTGQRRLTMTDVRQLGNDLRITAMLPE